MATKVQYVLQEIAAERLRQDEKWGIQNHQNGTGWEDFKMHEQISKKRNNLLASEKRRRWQSILEEEFWEASASDCDHDLRAELVQVAAVATAWIECIDRRTNEVATEVNIR